MTYAGKGTEEDANDIALAAEDLPVILAKSLLGFIPPG